MNVINSLESLESRSLSAPDSCINHNQSITSLINEIHSAEPLSISIYLRLLNYE